MGILANLEELKFKATLSTKLSECGINEFEAGKMARVGCYALTYKNNSFGVSQWVSQSEHAVTPTQESMTQ